MTGDDSYTGVVGGGAPRAATGGCESERHRGFISESDPVFLVSGGRIYVQSLGVVVDRVDGSRYDDHYSLSAFRLAAATDLLVRGVGGGSDTRVRACAPAPALALALLVCSDETTPIPIAPTPPQTPSPPPPPPPPPAVTLYTLAGVVFEVTSAGNMPLQGVEVYCERMRLPTRWSQLSDDRGRWRLQLRWRCVGFSSAMAL